MIVRNKHGTFLPLNDHCKNLIAYFLMKSKEITVFFLGSGYFPAVIAYKRLADFSARLRTLYYRQQREISLPK